MILKLWLEQLNGFQFESLSKRGRIFTHVLIVPENRHSHIGCICVTFLHCAFSNVSSNCLQQKRHIHIGCIFLKYWHHLLFSSGFFLLHPLNQGHKFPFVPLPLCVVFCPNGCFKLSLNCNKVKFFFAYFHFLATHQQTIIKWWWSS